MGQILSTMVVLPIVMRAEKWLIGKGLNDADKKYWYFREPGSRSWGDLAEADTEYFEALSEEQTINFLWNGAKMDEYPWRKHFDSPKEDDVIYILGHRDSRREIIPAWGYSTNKDSEVFWKRTQVAQEMVDTYWLERREKLNEMGKVEEERRMQQERYARDLLEEGEERRMKQEDAERALLEEEEEERRMKQEGAEGDQLDDEQRRMKQVEEERAKRREYLFDHNLNPLNLAGQHGGVYRSRKH